MRTLRVLTSLLIIGGLITFNGCKKDEEPDVLTLVSIEGAGTDLESGQSTTVDLNTATAAADVPLDVVITITFSRDVDPATATSSDITLAKGSDLVAVNISVSVSGAVVTITPQDDLDKGTLYTLTLAATITASDGGTFEEITRTFTTGGRIEVTPPNEDNQVAYWTFDGDAESSVGSFTIAFEKVNYSTDRHGFSNSAASFGGAATAGTGDLVEITADDAFVSSSMTITTWFSISAADYENSRFMFGLAAERGYFMELGSGSVSWMKFATSHALDPDPQNHKYGTAWTDPNGDGQTGGQVLYDYNGSISSLVADGYWHQLAMTFDASTSIKTIFIDGQKIMQVDIDSETTEWYLKDMAINEEGVTDLIDKNLAFGFACSRDNEATDWAIYDNATNTYKGLLDDFRMFNVAFTEAEVLELYDDEKPGK